MKISKRVASLLFALFLLIGTVPAAVAGEIAESLSYSCSHTYVIVFTQSASCTVNGAVVYQCTKCGDTFSVTLPKEHLYNSSGAARKICTRSTSCGNLNGATSSMFQHYMYRTGSLTGADDIYRANYISNGPNEENHAGASKAIDITTGYQGKIKGYPIYAQGSGTVASKSDPNSLGKGGYFIKIAYSSPNVEAGYMHFQNQPSLTVGASVTAATQLGTTGNTGTGNDPNGIVDFHVHLEIKVGGSYQNADQYFPSIVARRIAS